MIGNLNNVMKRNDLKHFFKCLKVKIAFILGNIKYIEP